MKNIYLFSILSILFSFCNKEKLTPICDGSNPAYNQEIKAIIDATCLSAGCHNTGSSNGDWTTYNNLKLVLDNGNFKNRILTKQTMPIGKRLTQVELNLIQCWVDNGYPEN